jgi:GTPase SAR1 family protein
MTVIHDSAATVTATTLPITASLEQLQTDEQRHVLDVVAQIRKCGLDGVLSLPQLVVCGDQSAGKSSVLEALTEIPFPRNDNLCTRFATEITLRRANVELLIVRVIPDPQRPAAEQATINAFGETIVDFNELPQVMAKAMAAMGLDTTLSASSSARAFSRDILSIEIEGPSRPQLTLVDVPGLIQTETKGVTRQDRDMVTEITEFYIRQPRTICLAVVSATNDYANQPILTKVREVDPSGERTLGIITKPDRLDQGSGMEAAFLALARNEDIFFKLGWHVVKNRKFEESTFSIEERNAAEAFFFRNSNFKTLPADCVGIDALRVRLSALLFEHVKRELPNLRRDLDMAMTDTTFQLDALGTSRATPLECRTYLTQLSMTCLDISKAAINGHYEGDYFQVDVDEHFCPDSPASIRRFRAVIQYLNRDFAEEVRKNGPKYFISSIQAKKSASVELPSSLSDIDLPVTLSKDEGVAWVARVLERTRGKEPIGNYNPLIIGELFWELSFKWSTMATKHVERVFEVSKMFFESLLEEKAPKDVRTRLQALRVTDTLQSRRQNALEEVKRLIDDKREFPVTYNHYYTDTIQKKQSDRTRHLLERAVGQATTETHNPGCTSSHSSTNVDVAAVVAQVHSQVDRDMVHYSCEHLLDCVLSMYKVGRS